VEDEVDQVLGGLCDHTKLQCLPVNEQLDLVEMDEKKIIDKGVKCLFSLLSDPIMTIFFPSFLTLFAMEFWTLFPSIFKRILYYLS
jgi:hypothetical protein